MTDLLLNTRRAKNLRLPTASSRQYVTSSSAFPSSHHLLPRRSVRAIESDTDDVPEKPLTAASDHPGTSLIARPLITARRRWPDKSPSRSEYAPSVTRRASPARSVASLTNRRSRSPAKGGNSVDSGGNEGGKLWMALKEVSLSRQAKGSWTFRYTGSLNYYLIYGFIALSYLPTYVLFLFMQSMISCSGDGLDWHWLRAQLRIAVILPSHPVRDDIVWGSGYKEQDKVFVESVFR